MRSTTHTRRRSHEAVTIVAGCVLGACPQLEARVKQVLANKEGTIEKLAAEVSKQTRRAAETEGLLQRIHQGLGVASGAPTSGRR